MIFGHSDVQMIAKKTIEYIMTEITAGMKLKEICRRCEDKMLELGADSFWYWDISAIIYSGGDTRISVPGSDYSTADKTVKTDDIITLDLNPQVGDIWGDYARTIIVENGKVIGQIHEIANDEWRNGMTVEKKLHSLMMEIVSPQMTFEELYERIHERVEEEGFVNLDMKGKYGHSIARREEKRIYVEKGNKAKLGDVSYFAFETHIGLPDSKYGFKRENIYHFKNGVIKEL